MDPQHAEHWDSTLMGRRFWEDATTHEQSRVTALRQDPAPNQQPRVSFDQPIPKEITITTAQETEKDEQTTAPRHRRGMSFQDLPRLRVRTGLRRNATITPTISTSSLLTPDSRSAPPEKTSSLWSPLSSLPMRLTPRTPKSLKFPPLEPPIASPTQTMPPSSPSPTPRSVHFAEEPRLESPARPYYKSFENGPSWDDVPRCTKRLKLDLLVSFPGDSDADDKFLNIEDMKPLLEFRQLRSLHISGMVKSYQTYIWQTVWLNVHLEELELEMAVEPRLNQISKEMWTPIREGWKMGNGIKGQPVYHGYGGTGELHPDLGEGEYLDKYAIEKAKIRAVVTGGATNTRIPIKKLTLKGFVVDADPIFQWFDPQRLRTIYFKGDCIDAGVWLAPSMSHVSLRVAKELDIRPVAVGIIKIELGKDVKAVNVRHKNVKDTVPNPITEASGAKTVQDESDLFADCEYSPSESSAISPDN